MSSSGHLEAIGNCKTLQLGIAQNLLPLIQSLDGSYKGNGLAMANVRHYVIYDFKGKAPEASTACTSVWSRMARPSGFITASLGQIDQMLPCR